jgi:hypothetical protein
MGAGVDGTQQCCVAEWSYILRGWNAVMFLYNAVGVVSLLSAYVIFGWGWVSSLGSAALWVVATGGVVVVIKL